MVDEEDGIGGTHEEPSNFKRYTVSQLLQEAYFGEELNLGLWRVEIEKDTLNVTDCDGEIIELAQEEVDEVVEAWLTR